MNFYSKTKNKNYLKVNQRDLKSLNDLIEEIDLVKESKNDTVFITINTGIFNTINIKEINDPLSNFIKKELENVENRPLLSCRKLATKYNEETGLKSNRTYIKRIIQDKFG